MANTIIVVGPQQLAKFFSDRIEGGISVEHVDTLKDLDHAINNKTIDLEPIAMVIHYLACQGDEDNLVYTSAALAAETCLLLVAPEDKQDEISGRINKMVTDNNYVSAPFFFLPTQKPIGAAGEFIEQWKEWKNRKEAAQNMTHDEDLDTWENINSDDFVDTETEETGTDGIVICVTSSKGGSGKSTISILTATQIAHSSNLAFEQGKTSRPARVCLVDMDVTESQIGFVIGKTSPTVTNMVAESQKEDMFTIANVQKFAVHDDNLGVDFYLAPRLPTAADAVPASFYAHLIPVLKKMYDIVILDSSVNYIKDERIRDVAYPMSDALLCITTLDSRTIFLMSRWVTIVTAPKDEGGLGINPAKVGIIVNRAHSSSGISKANLFKAIGNEKIQYVGALPDLPAAVSDKCVNLHRMDLFLRENDFGFGKALYNISTKLCGDTPLAPIVTEDSSRNSRPARTASTMVQQQPQPQVQVPQQKPKKKRKKIFGLF